MKSKINTKIIDGWKYIRIGQLFKKSISGEWGSDPDGKDDVMVIGTPDFNNDGTINWNSLRNRNIKTSRLSIRLINKGSILIEKSGGSDDQPAGRVVYCDKSLNGTCSNFVQLLTVSDEFDSKFIFYVLYFYYKKGLIYPYQQKTTGIINFKINEYFKEQVLLPELKTEQIKIERILSTIDKLIQETEKIIKKYKKIKQGLMQDFFRYGIDEKGQIRNKKTHQFKDTLLGCIPKEWEVNKLIDFKYRDKQIVQTGPFGSQLHSSDYVEDGVPFILIKNFSDEGLNEKYIPKISFRDAKRLEKYSLKVGDIVFSRVGRIGSCFLVGIKQEDFIISGQLLRIRANSHLIDPSYLAYVLQTDMVQNQIINASVGTTRGSLNTSILENLYIIHPKSLGEQKKISLILDKTVLTIKNEENYKLKLLSIKQGLMHDLLSGKFCVNKLIN